MLRHSSTATVGMAWKALWVSATIFGAQPAVAEELASPPSSAQRLFDEARELMEHSQFAEACPKLRGSLQLDPATGTLLNLAFCFEQQGKSASAYNAYKQALARSEQEGNHARQQFAEERIAVLEPTLTRLGIVTLALEEDLWITLDGERLDVAHLGTTIPVDPGRHVLEYGAPHKRPVTLTVNAKRSPERLRIEIQPLQVVSSARPVPIIASTAPVQPTEVHSVPWPVAGVSFGVALSGAVVTAYFGLRAKNAWDERNRLCASGCTDRASQVGQRADTYAWVANVSAGVALLSAGVGTYWLLNGHSSTPRARTITWVPTVHRQGAGIGATVAF